MGRSWVEGRAATPKAKVPPEGLRPEMTDAVWFAREKLRFDPDLQQEELLRCDAKQGILNCSRHWGKSTVAAIKAVHRAYSQAGSLVLVASPADRQSGNFILIVREFVMTLGFPIKGDGVNKLCVRLPNGSRIVGLPGNERTTRGFSANLLIIDEASRVKDDYYQSLRPMLTTENGDLWMLSTPWGKRGFFYEQWEHGGADWARFRGPATECPRIAPARLELERRHMGEESFRREYMCEFTATETQMFDTELVRGTLEDGEEEWRLD